MASLARLYYAGRMLSTLCLAVCLSSCSMFDKSIEIAIFSESDANVNAKGQPAPIVVHAMTLKDQGMIQKIKVTELYSLKSGAVGPDIVKFSTLNVLPMMQQKRTIKLDDNDRYLAITGLFRRHKGVQWRTIMATKDLPHKIYLVARKDGLKKVSKSEFYTRMKTNR